MQRLQNKWVKIFGGQNSSSIVKEGFLEEKVHFEFGFKIGVTENASCPSELRPSFCEIVIATMVTIILLYSTPLCSVTQ